MKVYDAKSVAYPVSFSAVSLDFSQVTNLNGAWCDHNDKQLGLRQGGEDYPGV